MESQLVWAPHSSEGYALGRVEDIRAGETALVRLEPTLGHGRSAKGPERLECPLSQVFPVEIDLKKDHADNCSLMYLNEANLLHNVRLRYFKNEIYTYVANILIAVNPYHNLKGQLYSPEVLRSYQGKTFSQMAPHVFAIADRAYHDIKRLGTSQSIIVSGESGAGKTESTKYILRYLCESFSSNLSASSVSGGGQPKAAIHIEQLILEANPLLEAFGNAKTARNNNSSRFGKFIEIHFDRKFAVAGGHILHYLLEKSRICGQISEAERNYHIFYQLCSGLPEPARSKLKLGPPDTFNYLKRGCTRYFLSGDQEVEVGADRKSSHHRQNGGLGDAIVNDLAGFKAMDSALNNFGVDGQGRAAIYQVVAAILHLGNIEFEESPDDSRGGCRVQESCQTALQNASSLLGVDVDQLQQCLQSRVMQTNKGGYKGSIYMVPLKVYEAASARDALAKAIYSRLFDYIVSKVINKALPGAASAFSIGVLDIAGFEYFQTNSFEQFCINYCNEKLQNFFNERILNDEQRLYEQESLAIKRIEYVDNRDCIELLEAKGSGIFDLLDEESRLPKPAAQHFTTAVHQANKSQFRLDVPRKSKLRMHRELRDDEGFIIRHFAGAVCYQTSQFIEKNNDTLHTNLAFLMIESEDKLLKELFSSSSSSSAANKSNGNGSFISSTTLAEKTVKLSAESIGGKFRKQLADLIAKLESTGTHFVRCIKPNLNMIASEFDGACILSQLKCSGMASVLELMQYGFPSRATYAHIHELYSPRLPPKLARLGQRHFSMALVKAMRLPESDVRFGVTKVFFRPGRFAEFDTMMKTDKENLDQLIERLARWLIISRWKRAQYSALSVIKLRNKIAFRRACIVTIQKTLRMAADIRRYRPRYLGRKQLTQMRQHLVQLASLVSQVSMNDERVNFDKRLANLEAEIRKLRDEFIVLNTNDKKVPILPKAVIEENLSGVRSKIDALVADLKSKLAEQERLRCLQLELEEQRRQREEEERRKQEAEEIRRRKAELEERKRLERQAEEAAKAQALKEAEAAAAIESSSTETNGGNGGSYDSLTLGISEEERLRQAHALKRLEQERRDYELAMRLARDGRNESGAGRAAVAPTVAGLNFLNDDAAAAVQAAGYGSPSSSPKSESNRKYKLENWNYAQLRDTINTSSDIELLEACREEFHRRLKVYHHWKIRNNKGGSLLGESRGQVSSTSPNSTALPSNGQSGLRAPASVIETYYGSENANKKRTSTNSVGTTAVNENGSNEQRYFRLPFVRAGGQSKGLWYAHFDGKWIARQMEIHIEREPILLVAGNDDLQMCELSLEETRLTKKRGVEILPEEFEAEWIKNGGPAKYARALK